MNNNSHKKLKIGITGGIGSGKTTICKIFEFLGIPVYYADIRAKQLMVSDTKLIASIKKLLGNNSYKEDASLNKAYIADIVFYDEIILQQLNDLVHPAVEKDFEKWAESQISSCVIQENALLFETGRYKKLHINILVSAPLELRIQRVLKRDNTDRESILARVKNQLSEEKKLKLADIIINNDGTHSIIERVLDLYKKFQCLCRENRK